MKLGVTHFLGPYAGPGTQTCVRCGWMDPKDRALAGLEPDIEVMVPDGYVPRGWPAGSYIREKGDQRGLAEGPTPAFPMCKATDTAQGDEVPS